MSKLKDTFAAPRGEANHPPPPAPTLPRQPRAAAGLARFASLVEGGVREEELRDVDPDTCHPWDGQPRMWQLLNEENCADLIASIQAKGQENPATVRPAPKGRGAQWEIIGGTRRWWVAKFLGRKLTIRIKELDDEAAFLSGEADNDYENVSEYERAVKYAEMLNRLYEGNQSKMAARLNMDAKKLSRYIAFAQLDREIVEAFGNPTLIKQDYAERIRKSTKTPDRRRRLLEAARSLATEQKAGIFPPQQVIKRLLGAVSRTGRPKARTILRFQASESRKEMLTAQRCGTQELVLRCRLDVGATIEEMMKVMREAVEKLRNETGQ